MDRYDIFISFKHTDHGRITSDSHVAEQLYYLLTDAGFRVFYSEEELRLLGESEYMVAIDKALKESWGFIVIASTPEYINSGWVAQEWRAFANMAMKDPRRKVYSLLMEEMTVEELPPLLSPYQSFCFEDGINNMIQYIMNTTVPSVEQIESIDPDPVKRAVRLGFGIGQRRDFASACAYIKTLNIDHPLLNAMLVKQQFDGEMNKEVTGALLQKLCECSSVAGPYWISNAYRHGYFGLEVSISSYKKYLSLGRENWDKLVAGSKRTTAEKKDLVIYTYSEDSRYLNAAEYMCACIYEIISIFDIRCEIRPVTHSDYPTRAQYEKDAFVLFAATSTAAFDGETEEERQWLAHLCSLPKEKMYLGLAGVRMADISKKFRNRHFVLNNEGGIGHYCDHIIGRIKGDGQ